MNSLKGAWYSLRAGYTFIDALMRLDNWQYCGGSKIIQLSHGKGFKKVAYESPYSLPRYNRMLMPHIFQTYDKVAADSEYTAKMNCLVYRTPMEKMMITGLPRQDIFFHPIAGAEIDSIPRLKETTEKMRAEGARKIILYAPTYRPDGTNPVFENVKSGTRLSFQLDLKRLDDLLGKNHSKLFISLHPKFGIEQYGKENLKNISCIQSKYDFYPSFPLFDAVITDYSSIFSDFLKLNRPIIFLVYDLEKYKKEAGLFEDFDTLAPGVKVFDNDGLIKELEKILNGQDEYKDKRNKVRNIFYKYDDGNASQRIAKILLKEI